MKNLLSYILVFLPSLILLVVPELISFDVVVASFLTLSGLSWLTIVLTEFVKKVSKYKPGEHSAYFPQVIAVIISVLLGVSGKLLNLGIFTYEMYDLNWVGTFVVSLIVWGVSMGYYDLEFARSILKRFLGLDIR